jgi:hypothetical protein
MSVLLAVVADRTARQQLAHRRTTGKTKKRRENPASSILTED